MSAEQPVAEVIANDYKKPFMLLVAIGVVLATVLFLLTSAEKFVDGRVELKLAYQRQQAEEQGKRIERIEQQFSLMRDTLSEIRADVRVLRARVEGSDRDGREDRSDRSEKVAR